MNALPITDSERPSSLERRFAAFSPEALAWLALPPGWTYEAASRANFPTRDGDLGELLDAFTRAGLCTPGSAMETHAWTLLLHATSEFRGTNTVEQRVKHRIGSLLTTVPDDSPAGRARISTQQLRLREVDLRSREIRLSDRQNLAEGQRIHLQLRPAMARTDTPAGPAVTGTVIKVDADAWAGRTAIVALDAAPREQPTLEAWIYRTFSVPRTVRRAVLAYLQNRPQEESSAPVENVGVPRVDLVEMTRRIAEGLRGEEWLTPLPDDLRRWRDLASAAQSWSGALAEQLDRLIEPHLASGAIAEVQAWLEVAEELTPVFGGQIDASVRLARRRLELIWRRAADQRHLLSFLPRAEQIQAFRDLLEARDGQWALHYLGVGGVGKTMLLRHITAELVGARPYARIDFDYLSPDYPVRRPGQLLLELADGLRTFGRSDGDTESRFLEFRSRVEELHRFAEDVPAEIRKLDPLFALHEPALHFDQLVDDFTAYLRSLQLVEEPGPDGSRARRVLLLLDTCEELARLQRDGEFQPAVRATFEILERVQKRLDALRASDASVALADAGQGAIGELNAGAPSGGVTLAVVFAGRRLLATAGHGWRGAQGNGAGVTGDVRPYLRLHLIRGFTLDETTRFLTEKKAPEPQSGIPPMPPALQRAVRARSRETGDATHILESPSTTETTPAAESETVSAPTTPLARASALRQLSPLTAPLRAERQRLLRVLQNRCAPLHLERQRVLRVLLQAPGRFNPFDLSFYADWYLEDPSLAPESVEQGDADSYVEMRLLHRLHTQVRAALPYLVLLRRGERSLLKSILEYDETTFGPLFDELCQLEWIDYQTEQIGSSGRTYLAVDRNLLPRLQRYFGDTPLAPQSDEARIRRRSLDQAKSRLAGLLSTRLRANPTSEIDSAELFAALRLLPAEAASQLWATIEIQVVAERAWDWARQTTDRLLNPEDPVPRAVRAHVRSTRISARLHEGRELTDRDGWLMVQDEAADCPVPAIREWLLVRARLAQVTAIAESWTLNQGQPFTSFPDLPALAEAGAEPDEHAAFRKQQLIGAYAHALHALSERSDRDPQGRESARESAEPLLRQLRLAAVRGPAAVLLDLLLARQLPAGSVGAATAFEAVRIQLEPAAVEETTGPDWLDWALPPNWSSRLRLEWLHFAPRAETRVLLRKGEFDLWQRQALTGIQDEDAALVLSALLSLRLDEQPLPIAALAEIEPAAAAFPGKPLCNAQRATPPLFITLARAWSAHGEIRRAVALLHQQLNHPNLDAGITRQAEETLLVIARRMRDFTIGTTVQARWLGSSRYEYLVHVWPVFRLSQPFGTQLPNRPSAPTPDLLHAWWQAQTALSPADRAEALTASPQVFESAAAHAMPWLAAALRLDGMEAVHVAKNAGTASTLDRVMDTAAAGRLTAQTILGERLPRDRMRLSALTEQPRLVAEFPIHHGSHQVADWALTEGELLVTRVPPAGLFLLTFARETFASIQHDLGVFMASVCAAVALIHQRKEGNARNWLQDHAAPSYERLRLQRSLPELAVWQAGRPEAFVAAQGSTDSGLVDLHGWLVRFSAAWVFLSKPRQEWENGAWQSWLAERFPGRSVPFELELCPPAAPPLQRNVGARPTMPAMAEPLARPLLSAQPRRSFVPRLLLLAAICVGGYLLVHGAIWLWFSPGYSLPDPGDGEPDPSSVMAALQQSRTLILAAIVALAVLLARWVVRLRRKTAAARAREAGLMMAMRPASAKGEVEVVVAWPTLPQRIRKDDSASLRRVTLQLADAERAPQPQPEVAARSIQAAIAGSKTELLGCALAVAPGLEGVSWESQLRDLLTNPSASVVVYRWMQPVNPGRPGDELARQVLALGPTRWLPVCEQGWRQAPRLHYHGSSRSLARSRQLPATPGIVHLVGSVIRVRAGERLRIGDVGGYGRPAEEIEALLIGPDELPLATAELVIVQGEPSQLVDLQQTGLRELQSLRVFAHAIFRAGARSVLLLPRLPAHLVQPVIGTIATSLAAQPHPSCGDLVALTRNLRRVIVRDWNESRRSRSAPAGPKPEDYALQVTLFARSRWADPSAVSFPQNL